MTRSYATTRHFVIRSIPEAARETGVSEATLRRWVDDRALSAVPLGRTTMVNVLEVESLRARAVLDPGPPGGDWSAHYWLGPWFLRLVGATNTATGVAGVLAFAGVGPGDLDSPWWLALCMTSVAVGVLELRGLPRRSRHRGSALG